MDVPISSSEDGLYGQGEFDLQIPQEGGVAAAFNVPEGFYTARLLSGLPEMQETQPVYFADTDLVIEQEYAALDLTPQATALARAGGISQLYVCDVTEGKVDGKIFSTELATSEIRLLRNGETVAESVADEFGDFRFEQAELLEGLTELQFELDPEAWEIPDFGVTVPGGWYLPRALHVDVNASGADLGLSWIDAYTSLEQALDHWAVSFYKFEIWVADGIYPIANSVSAKFQPGMQIYGGFGGYETVRTARHANPGKTILTGDVDKNDQTFGTGIVEDPVNQIKGTNSQRLIEMKKKCDRLTILDGMTVTAFNGLSTAFLGMDSDLTLLNMDFVGNQSGTGGALEINFQCRANIDSVKFRFNRAVDGGAIEITSSGGYFVAGRAGWLQFVRCHFEGNEAELGGCLIAESMPDPIYIGFENCMFLANKADNGGVAFLVNSPGDTDEITAKFGGCVFNGNRATRLGGVAYLELHDPNCALVTCDLINCTFSNNSANFAAMAYARSFNTGQISRAARIEVTSSIAWRGASATSSEFFAYGADAQISIGDTILQGGTNNSVMVRQGATLYTTSPVIASDPKLIDIDGADGYPGTADDKLQLQSGSPAIDQGSTTYNVQHEFGTIFDIDWNFRFINGRIDMGAYEKQ